MPKTITQKIIFQHTTPQTLYDLYMDAEKHTAATGAGTYISGQVNTKFTSQDGYFSGENLLLVKNKTIVQSLRASDWTRKDPPSIFILQFEENGDDAVMYVTHANLPDREAKNIAKGWHSYYWKPWKNYLSNK